MKKRTSCEVRFFLTVFLVSRFLETERMTELGHQLGLS